jgi:hypothetical protein
MFLLLQEGENWKSTELRRDGRDVQDAGTTPQHMKFLP